MPRIIITSDIHHDSSYATPMTSTRKVEALVEQINTCNPDCVAIAGDIGCSFRTFCEALHIFKKGLDVKTKIGVIAGNHDVWAHDIASWNLFSTVLPDTVQEFGFTWLETDTIKLGPIGIVGTLAWYDYSASPLTLPTQFYWENKKKYNQDAKYVNWPFTDVQFEKQLRDSFLERLMAAEKSPDISKICVVTHVPCFSSQLKPSSKVAWKASQAYFGNFTLGKAIMPFSKVEWVISGHTHQEMQGIQPRQQDPYIKTYVIGSDYGHPVFQILDCEG